VRSVELSGSAVTVQIKNRSQKKRGVFLTFEKNKK